MTMHHDPAAAAHAAPPAEPPRAALYGVYCTGLFSMGLLDFFVLLVPLWALSLGMSGTEIGILVGARSLLPFLLAIHGGALMDRFGARRVMLVVITLVAVAAPIYPLLHLFPALLALQLIVGVATSYAWIGAQTLIAQVSGGDTTHIGRFSFCGRIGTFTVPIIGGALWDFAGPWLTFMTVSLWCLCLFVCVWMAPPVSVGQGTRSDADRPPPASRLVDVLPRARDYMNAFALLAIPMVGMTIVMNFLRNTTSAVQGSFYVIYLDEIALSATAIGILFAVLEAASGLTSLGSAFYLRYVKPHWLIIILAGAAIALIAITPLLGGIFALLVVAQALRGGAQGLIQPVLFSLQAKAVPMNAQGSVIGLRVSVNRLSAVIIPPIMGAVVDVAGLTAGFLVIGGVLLTILATLAIWVNRSPAFSGNNNKGKP